MRQFIKSLSVFIVIVLFIVVILLLFPKNNNSERGLLEIYKICKNQLWEEKNDGNNIECVTHIVNKNGEVYFDNVDYTSQRSTSWPVQEHLINIKKILHSYGRFQLQSDKDIQQKVIGLIDFWLENDFYCQTNWWPNNIGVPRHMAEITLMIKEYLSDGQLAKIKKILDRGSIGINKELIDYTAANKIDVLDITMKRALIFGESKLLKRVSKEVGKEIKICQYGEDGIWEDMTYFDHGNVLATAGSYGVVYTEGIANLIVCLSGSIYSVSHEKEKLFIDYMLDGERFFHRKNGTCYFSIARSAVYGNGGEKIYKALEKLKDADIQYRHDEIVKYYSSYKDYNEIKTEVKYFPLSGTFVAVSPNYYFAIRGAKKGLGMTDIVNNQGVLNYNLSYGNNTCFMDTGEEYKKIGAVIDYSMYPGTTTYLEDDEELYQRYEEGFGKKWGRMGWDKSDCSCNISDDGKAAIMKSELHNGDISGKICYIFYKGVLYILGSDFNAAMSDKKIVTTVEQCVAEGKEHSQITLTRNKSICNNSYCYTNLCSYDLISTNKEQIGNYRRSDAAGDDTNEQVNVFKAYFDWGKDMNKVSYAYSVTPKALVEPIKIERIINNEKMSVIEFKDGKMIGCFYESCTYKKVNGDVKKCREGQLVIE